MNHLRKKALGLAIAGVIYGGVPVVYAADVNISSGGTAVTLDDENFNADDDLVVEGSANFTTDSGTALTIDTSTDELENVTINSSITAGDSGTALAIGKLGTGLTNNGKIEGGMALEYTGTGAISVTNNGSIIGEIELDDSSANLNFVNGKNGTAYVKFNHSGTQSTAVTNTGTVVVRSGSNLGGGNFNTAGGTLEVSFESAETGITTLGQVIVDDSTVIKISASPAILKTEEGVAGITGLQAALRAAGSGQATVAGIKVTDVPLFTLVDASRNPQDHLYFLENGQAVANADEISNEEAAALAGRVVAGNILMKIENVRVTSTGIVADISTNSVDDIVAAIGFSDVVQQIAESFQKGIASGDLKALEDLYGELVLNVGTEEALANYLNKIRPDDSGVNAEAGVEMADAVSGNISSRGTAVRTGVNTGDMFSVDGFWVQGIYGESEQKSDGVDLGYDGKLRGFTMGADRENGNMTTGFAFSYANADTDFNGRDQLESVKSYMGSLYTIWQRGNHYVDASLSYGVSNHESKRYAGDAAATAKYDSWQLGGNATLGFYKPLGNVMMEPMLSTRMTYVGIDDYQYVNDNSGAAIDNSSGSASFKKLDFGVGIAFSTVLAKADEGVFITPRVSAVYYHDVLNDTIEKDISFDGDNYRIKSANKQRDSLEVGLSLDISAGDHVTVSAGYDRVHKDDFSSDNYSFKFRYDF